MSRSSSCCCLRRSKSGCLKAIWPTSSATIDALELSAFHGRYAGGGPRNQPFHPTMMVKVLVYAYATGVFSSRQIARKLHEDVAFRVLGANNFPKHRTICDFRALHLKEFSALFVQVVTLARECGLAKLGTDWRRRHQVSHCLNPNVTWRDRCLT